MLISRRYDYAIRIIRALSDGEKYTIGQICEQEKIPLSFAYKIAKALAKSSMIKGHSGANGGYQLNKPITDISLADIYLAVEGDLYINECLLPNAPCPNNGNGEECKVHKLLAGLQDTLINTLAQLDMETVLK